MARPKKSRLDYFPFDVDFFEDEKMIAIAGEFGIRGELAAIKLLCAVYRNGYFIEWSEMLQMKLMRQLPGVSAGLLNQIVTRLVKWGFFDYDLFDSAKVLTSVGIQRRYFEATKYRTTDETYPYLLIDSIKRYDKKGVSQKKTPVSQKKTPVSQKKTPTKENKLNNKKSPNGDTKDRIIPGLLDFGNESKNSWPKDGFPIPTLDEVKAYFKNHPDSGNEWELQASLFFSHYDGLGWKNSHGKRIERWDSTANNWIWTSLANERNGKTNTCKSVSQGNGVPIKGRITPGYGLLRSDQKRED